MTDNIDLLEISVSQQFCRWAAGFQTANIPDAVRGTLSAALLDYAGLCVASHGLNYVGAMIKAQKALGGGDGPCTVIGHGTGMDASGAALVNGTAAHGEDYDDTFEGTPVHTGAVIWPAVLAAGERFGASGADILRGAAVGTELMCRMALVAPTAMHKAGFHPTAIIGALGSAAAVGTTLRVSAHQMTDALGIAGSFASGIIEYLAEGSWTKRLHAGWAAQSGLRAALLGREGFLGPRTVMEGQHGFFFGFADHAISTDYTHLTDGLGLQWHASNIAFKPYACGTMTQPFIDCAIQLANRGVAPGDIDTIECKVGDGTVHRLWEPLSEKRNPSTPYSAKFSVPFCIAVGLVDSAAGLEQFTEERITDETVLAVASNVSYQIDPENDYPANYSGHIRATLKDGAVHEVEQPHLRGGEREPMPREELNAKFHANVAFGGWSQERATELQTYCTDLSDAVGLSGLKAFRQ
ncbi:MmgE/PrpD family protein [Alphaproteobacteria bacterium]|nr:MmgE/PrpD family protein [Alphaproteobacteria bacterium]